MSKIRYPYTLHRVGATLIDYTIVIGLSILYIVNYGTEDQQGNYTVTDLAALPPIAFWFVYFVLTERYMGGTLGHQLCKIKVISLDGNELSFVQVFLRRIMDALEISWCFGLIAFILVRTDQHNQRLGDKVAKTKVVGKKDRYADVKFDFDNPLATTNETISSKAQFCAF